MTKSKGKSKRAHFADTMKPKGKAAERRKRRYNASKIYKAKQRYYKLLARNKSKRYG